MRITVRPMSTEDCKSVAAMANLATRSLGCNIVYTTRHYESIVDAENMAGVVAEAWIKGARDLAGFATYATMPNQVGVIGQLVVSTDYRRMGVGSTLLMHLIEEPLAVTTEIRMLLPNSNVVGNDFLRQHFFKAAHCTERSQDEVLLRRPSLQPGLPYPGAPYP